MKLKTRIFALAAALLLLGATAARAQPYVNATVDGILAPGVYGRINIGNAPPPPVLYAQPVIITRPAVQVQQPPLYLYVPPGHAKKWSKHCAQYNACGRQVYFVNVDSRGKYKFKDRDRRGWDGRGDNGKHAYRDNDRGHGNGHGHRD
ncbi:hypothetical protein [Rhodoferax sediminis]|uniref:DUF3300 domain-containing protein n=1 Tax=Rhodoferax sediminis TaxID=2509614 RepID=A0A515DD74_9BURK|nr:hypothetical protein [Rhodoferax sediminis]QDL38382.1 hypothetical protein EUB48_14590 [Rhodoferax sediminis]